VELFVAFEAGVVLGRKRSRSIGRSEITCNQVRATQTARKADHRVTRLSRFDQLVYQPFRLTELQVADRLPRSIGEAQNGDRVESLGKDQLAFLRREVDCVGDSYIVEALRFAVVEVGRPIDRPSDVSVVTPTVEREAPPVCESQRRAEHLST
jgi:hypothetical protein